MRSHWHNVLLAFYFKIPYYCQFCGDIILGSHWSLFGQSFHHSQVNGLVHSSDAKAVDKSWNDALTLLVLDLSMVISSNLKMQNNCYPNKCMTYWLLIWLWNVIEAIELWNSFQPFSGWFHDQLHIWQNIASMSCLFRGKENQSEYKKLRVKVSAVEIWMHKSIYPVQTCENAIFMLRHFIAGARKKPETVKFQTFNLENVV